jgi:hypothetical protein
MIKISLALNAYSRALGRAGPKQICNLEIVFLDHPCFLIAFDHNASLRGVLICSLTGLRPRAKLKVSEKERCNMRQNDA